VSTHGCLVVGQRPGVQIDISGRASGTVRRHEDAALECEPTRMLGRGEAAEEAFQRVQLVKFIGGALLSTCEVLQVEVGAALDGPEWVAGGWR